VHLNTGCNTHDLLQCECDREIDGIDEEQLSETKQDEHCQGFVAASEVTNEKSSSAEESVCVIFHTNFHHLTLFKS
jgi:hypothetical protein